MKKGTILSLLFFLLIAGSIQAQQSRSDYAIQQDFKIRYQEFVQKLDTVTIADSAKAYADSIEVFEEEFSEHSELLDKALYPQTFEDQMKRLLTNAERVVERRERIEEQEAKLVELEEQLASYEENIGDLNKRSDSLKRAMEQSLQSERHLSERIRIYRESLEERDELILTFIDSMLVAYQQMDLEALQDIEGMDRKSRVGTDGNALSLIHQLVTDNLNILSQNKENLYLTDYLRMGEVQSEFESMWQQLGNRIVAVYDGEDAETMAKEIEQNINQWNQQLEEQTFMALQDSLSAKNLEIDSFQSGDELFIALNEYLDKRISESQEGASDENYEAYQRFQDFWQAIELDGQLSLAETGVISVSEEKELRNKVNTWRENTRPEGSDILLYLLGIVVILAIILAVLWIRERQRQRI